MLAQLGAKAEHSPYNTIKSRLAQPWTVIMSLGPIFWHRKNSGHFGPPQFGAISATPFTSKKIHGLNFLAPTSNKYAP